MSDDENAASLDINLLLENSRLWREALQAPRSQLKYVASQTLLSTRQLMYRNTARSSRAAKPGAAAEGVLLLSAGHMRFVDH